MLEKSCFSRSASAMIVTSFRSPPLTSIRILRGSNRGEKDLRVSSKTSRGWGLVDNGPARAAQFRSKVFFRHQRARCAVPGHEPQEVGLAVVQTALQAEAHVGGNAARQTAGCSGGEISPRNISAISLTSKRSALPAHTISGSLIYLSRCYP